MQSCVLYEYAEFVYCYVEIHWEAYDMICNAGVELHNIILHNQYEPIHTRNKYIFKPASSIYQPFEYPVASCARDSNFAHEGY